MTMEEFNRLMDIAEKDIAIPDKLDTQRLIELSISVSSKYQKWLGVFSATQSEYEKEKLELDKMEGEELYNIRFNKQDPRNNYGWKTKDEMESQYLQNPKFYDKRAAVELLKTQCQYIEKTLDNIKTYGFQIKNIIEVKKLSYGGI